VVALAQPDNRIAIDTVLQGDALARLKSLPDNSVDAIVTDPPAGISFMGKEWDTFSPEYLQQQAEREAKRKSLGPESRQYGQKSKGRSSSAFGDPAHYAGSYDFSRKGRDAFIKFMTDIMSEALRVLKPGGHALVWALPRTSHWTALALEDAGFEVREKLYHIFGSGFPKSHNISVAIDKHLKAEREVIGKYDQTFRAANSGIEGWQRPGHSTIGDITAPATPEAEHWQGWGTATKPAVEEWILCRKPLSEPSIAANVLRWNCGALNIDATRVGSREDAPQYRPASPSGIGHGKNCYGTRDGKEQTYTQGRWPANLLLSHSLWCVPNGTKRVRGNGHVTSGTTQPKGINEWGLKERSLIEHTDPDGMEEVEAWLCADDCPIAELDRQSGIRKSGGRTLHAGEYTPHRFKNTYVNNGGAVNNEEYSLDRSEGGASRYFTNFPPTDFVPFCYTSKASRTERNAGCEGLPEHKRSATNFDGAGGLQHRVGEDGKITPKAIPAPEGNNHPTVKSLSLMRWLVRLITPPAGIVLDPFLGSGSTAVAAIHEGMHFIGIEQDASYVEIAEARIAHAYREVPSW
jgi:DNA modification methylase